MRSRFELLDLLKAHKKGIRRAAVNSFGYIAESLGPQDVLQVLLTNLRVQERQSPVCSTVAIAIVAETCGREYSISLLRIHALIVFMRSFHMYSCHSQRIPHCGAERPNWMSEGTYVRLRVRWSSISVLRRLRCHDARGCPHRP